MGWQIDEKNEVKSFADKHDQKALIHDVLSEMHKYGPASLAFKSYMADLDQDLKKKGWLPDLQLDGLAREIEIGATDETADFVKFYKTSGQKDDLLIGVKRELEKFRIDSPEFEAYMTQLNFDCHNKGIKWQISYVDSVVAGMNASFYGTNEIAKMAGDGSNVNKPLWSPELHDGHNGCAVSVDKVLRQAGVLTGDTSKDPLTVLGLTQLLTAAPPSGKGAEVVPLWQAKDGDIVTMSGFTGDAGHVGIVGHDEKGNLVIYNNSQDRSATPPDFDWKWRAQPISMWKPYDIGTFTVYHLPETPSASDSPTF